MLRMTGIVAAQRRRPLPSDIGQRSDDVVAGRFAGGIDPLQEILERTRLLGRREVAVYEAPDRTLREISFVTIRAHELAMGDDQADYCEDRRSGSPQPPFKRSASRTADSLAARASLALTLLRSRCTKERRHSAREERNDVSSSCNRN